uniref:Uncharacterized protein n=1 Tax=Triticum urartu TaxID=4572 RepID=A0A8R7VBG3_TRIUA
MNRYLLSKPVFQILADIFLDCNCTTIIKNASVNFSKGTFAYGIFVVLCNHFNLIFCEVIYTRIVHWSPLCPFVAFDEFSNHVFKALHYVNKGYVADLQVKFSDLPPRQLGGVTVV